MYLKKYTNLLMLQHKPRLKTEREHWRGKSQNEIVDPWTTKRTETLHNTYCKLKYPVQYASLSWSSIIISENFVSYSYYWKDKKNIDHSQLLSCIT